MLTCERAEALKLLYWEDLCSEIDEEIKAATMQLRTICPEKLLVVQEKIRTLESVKGLLDRVIEKRTP